MLPTEWRRLAGAVVIAVSIALAGCGGSHPTADSGGGGGGGGGGAIGRAAYVGVATCAGCHADITEAWQGTRHSDAYATLADIGQGSNAACLACHTVGMGQDGGFVDVATTPNLIDVQCESCHGPGGEHAGAPSTTNIVRLVPSSTCGQCHSGDHHPVYEEWLMSKKSDSLGDNHADSCVQCHTAEGYVYAENSPTAPHESRLTQAATTNLECWTCHNPHAQVAGTEHQMRKPVSELCADCHRNRDGETVPGAARVHNPQSGVLNGTNGYLWNGTTYVTLPLPTVPMTHAQALAGDCATCHVYATEITNDVGETVNSTGHHFWPNLQACSQSGCHSNLTRQVTPGMSGAVTDGATDGVIALFNQTQADTQARLAGLNARLSQVSINSLTVPEKGAYDVAKWNYDVVVADKSKGVHNLNYTNLMLDETDRILREILSQP